MAMTLAVDFEVEEAMAQGYNKYTTSPAGKFYYLRNAQASSEESARCEHGEIGSLTRTKNLGNTKIWGSN